MRQQPGHASAAVGVADHAGWAVLVTVGPDAVVLDRRRVDLVDTGLPVLPHHHEGQKLPVGEAVALVEKVRASAKRCAARALESLARDVGPRLAAIALRACPPLPETIAARLADYRAQCMADTVMFRHALADAATARGWRVSWYEAKTVFDAAAHALGRDTIDDLLLEAGMQLGSPWRRDHRTAMAAAIAAA
ncbi:MAG: hypothetical protein AB7T63_11150 [Planctomycetota bacterium]